MSTTRLVHLGTMAEPATWTAVEHRIHKLDGRAIGGFTADLARHNSTSAEDFATVNKSERPETWTSFFRRSVLDISRSTAFIGLARKT